MMVQFGKRTAKVIRESLKGWIDSADSKQPLVLMKELSDPHAMNWHVLRRLLKGIGDRAGAKNVHPHRFRHSFGRSFGRLVNASMDATREQTRVFSLWRFSVPRHVGLVSFQRT